MAARCDGQTRCRTRDRRTPLRCALHVGHHRRPKAAWPLHRHADLRLRGADHTASRCWASARTTCACLAQAVFATAWGTIDAFHRSRWAPEPCRTGRPRARPGRDGSTSTAVTCLAAELWGRCRGPRDDVSPGRWHVRQGVSAGETDATARSRHGALSFYGWRLDAIGTQRRRCTSLSQPGGPGGAESAGTAGDWAVRVQERRGPDLPDGGRGDRAGGEPGMLYLAGDWLCEGYWWPHLGQREVLFQGEGCRTADRTCGHTPTAPTPASGGRTDVLKVGGSGSAAEVEGRLLEHYRNLEAAVGLGATTRTA